MCVLIGLFFYLHSDTGERDMPLIRLPKIRSHKEAKSSERDGDTGSLASGRNPSVTSLKSLGTTGEE